MGSQIEMIKDQEGNSHLIFDKSVLYDDSKMGDKFEDFENLRVLGGINNLIKNKDKKQNHFVAKVRSLKNNKIYAMRTIKLNLVSEENEELLFSQIEKLKTLNHPHILRYYKAFTDEDEDYLYIITEYMNNADLQSFIKAHQILKTKIKEEEIWNILLQCLSALEYLRKNNASQLGIKVTNIYLNNEQNLKLGLFNGPPKLGDKCHNIKEDIKELGLFFFKMCYSQFEFTIHKIVKKIQKEQTIIDGRLVEVEKEVDEEVYTEWNNDFPIKKEKNTDYSCELLDIVFKMIEEDINKRLSSEELYNIVRNEYVKKYTNNTSIKAVLRCLYSFPTFSKCIFEKEKDIIQYKEKYYINYLFLKTVKALSSNSNLNECLEDFRRALASENSKLDCSKEVDPVYILAFILEKMHREDNIITKTEIQPKNIEDLYIITPIHRLEEIERNKENELKKFKSFANRKINSIISKLFFSVMKTKRICKVCRSCTYSFSNNFFFLFDVSKIGNNTDNQGTFNILDDGFRRQHHECKTVNKEEYHLFCDTCLTEQNHNEFNRYYSFGKNLILCFFRGKNYENNKKIKIEENLEFTLRFNKKTQKMEYIAETESEETNTKYYLVGSVNRLINNNGKDEFYYFARDPNNKNYWYDSISEGKLEKAPLLSIMETGQVIILFYAAEK